jgi:3-oxoacyl-[acyl-carrier-protein] synthase-1
MAARAVAEVVGRHHLDPRETALILIPPERFRLTTFADADTVGKLAKLVSGKVGMQFGALWQVSEGGAASTASALELAARCFESRDIRHVVMGGVDTYVLEDEYMRLDTAGRLRSEGTAQGFTPGEAAVFVLLSREPTAGAAISAGILGWGDAVEPLSATSKSYSQGRGMLAALRAAVDRSGAPEAAVDWVVSNANGERYASWESILSRARFYRTHRDRMDSQDA